MMRNRFAFRRFLRSLIVLAVVLVLITIPLTIWSIARRCLDPKGCAFKALAMVACATLVCALGIVSVRFRQMKFTVFDVCRYLSGAALLLWWILQLALLAIARCRRLKAAFSNAKHKDKTAVVSGGSVTVDGVEWVVKWIRQGSDGPQQIKSVEDKIGGMVTLMDGTLFENPANERMPLPILLAAKGFESACPNFCNRHLESILCVAVCVVHV